MFSFFSKTFTYDRVVRMVLLGAALVLAFYLLRYLSPVLTPFFVAWVLAYILDPLVNYFQRFLKYRSLTILLVIISILSVISLVVFLMVPAFVDESIKLTNMLRANGELDNSIIPKSLTDLLQKITGQIHIDQMLTLTGIINLSKEVFPQAWSLLSNTFDLLKGCVSLVFCLIYLFFILRDQKEFTHGLLRLIPKRQKAFVVGVFHDLQRGMSIYFRRQALIAFIDAIMFCIGFSIIGMPMGLLMGLLLGVLNMVPYLQYLGLPPAAMLMVLKASESGSPIGWAIVSLLLVFLVVQIVQDFYLTPKLMGDSMGLNPAVVLLSLSVWSYLLGFIGLIIALPLTTILKSYYKRYILSDDSSVPFPNNPKKNSESLYKLFVTDEDKKKSPSDKSNLPNNDK